MLRLEMQEGAKRPSFVWCNRLGDKGCRVSYFAAADALVRLSGIGRPDGVVVSRDVLGEALEPVLLGLLHEAYMLGRKKSEADGVNDDFTVKKAIDVIADAVKKDNDLAWTWHCNIAMSFQDEGGDRIVSNNAAARFMQLMFGVDTKKCDQCGLDSCNEAASAPQEKLTEHQIRWVLNALSRLGSLAHFLNKLGIPLPKELAHINATLQGMHKHGTSDGKPYVEPEPPIPEGWRKATADEWRRKDVKFWSVSDSQWNDRPAQGSKFDAPIHGTRYIVPIESVEPIVSAASPLRHEAKCVQKRLTKKQIAGCEAMLALLSDPSNLFEIDRTDEGGDYWQAVYNAIEKKFVFGTTDGNRWAGAEPLPPPGYRTASIDEFFVEGSRFWCWEDSEWKHTSSVKSPPPYNRTAYIVPCRPPVPEGWRVASEDECHRSDIKTWEGSHDGDRGHWRVRPDHKIGNPFNGPNYLYIVPIEPPLTDEDACVWPRRLVMVRDENRHPWMGPYKYLGKTDASYSIDPNNGGCATDWKQARRATPEEIEKASKKS